MARTFVNIAGVLGIITALWCLVDAEYLPSGIWAVAGIVLLIASRSFDLPGREGE